jgi:hypothetical protein
MYPTDRYILSQPALLLRVGRKKNMGTSHAGYKGATKFSLFSSALDRSRRSVSSINFPCKEEMALRNGAH